MLKAWTGAGMGGAIGIIVAWWMRKAWGWEVSEDVQSAFGSIATGLIATLDVMLCSAGVAIAQKLGINFTANQEPPKP